MRDEDLVQSAIRTLRLLEALNHHGTARLDRLHHSTGLAKATIARQLHTLIAAGYVVKLSRLAGYTLAERVLRLSDGFRHSDLVVAVGRGHLDALTAEYKWPASLQTYDRGAMLGRYSTRGLSPLTVDPSRINRRFPLLTTAHGHVYLAFCPDAERELIMAMLKTSKSPHNALASSPKIVGRFLEEVRRQGYSLRARVPTERVLGFAVPVMGTAGVAATVGIRYFGSAMSPQEAVQRYLAPLRLLSTNISDAVKRAALQNSSDGPSEPNSH